MIFRETCVAAEDNSFVEIADRANENASNNTFQR